MALSELSAVKKLEFANGVFIDRPGGSFTLLKKVETGFVRRVVIAEDTIARKGHEHVNMSNTKNCEFQRSILSQTGVWTLKSQTRNSCGKNFAAEQKQ